MSFQNSQLSPFLIRYREVKSDGDSQTDILDSEDEIESIDELLGDVRSNIESMHYLEDLDVSSFFEDWISAVLTNSGSITGDYEEKIGNYLGYIAEDFSDSMLSRAREKGKYVVEIVSEGSLIVCHSFTGRKALTTDMDVIEELLSASNIDKLAEFQYNEDGEIVVNHFDLHDTQSFTNWLGIPEDEIAFDIKGDVRMYSQIDGIDTVFEFDQDAITSKLLGSDDYDLKNGKLVTPNEPDRRIHRIKWGYDTFTDMNEFKQELFSIRYNLKRARDLYDSHISDSISSFFEVRDREKRIVKDKGDSVEDINKPNVDFQLSYVNRQVKMDISWRSDLANDILSKREPIPIYHAGSEFSETPTKIGNFRVYNYIGLNGTQEEYIQDLLTTAEDLGTANLTPLFLHIIFELLKEDSEKPLIYLFDEFSDEFERRFLEHISDGSRVIQTEGREIGLEWKSPEWFERDSSVDTLAKGIHREFQNSRLLVLGISEDGKDVDVIDDGVKSEKLNKVNDRLSDEFGMDETHVWSIPISEGHAVVGVNVAETGTFEGDITFLE